MYLARMRKKYLRSVWMLLIAVACHYPVSHIDAAEQQLTEQEKRDRIEKMYEEYTRSFAEVSDLSPHQAMDLMETQKVILVDVRRTEEQEISMLPGAVTTEDFLENLNEYEDKMVIGYCTISYRSGKLAKKLLKRGITMHNLRGGILAWTHDGGKVYDGQGETKRVHVYGRKWNLAPQDYEASW